MATTDEDLHTIDDDLRSIQITEQPRLRPLDLDKMFQRVQEWGEAHPSIKPPPRPSSPSRRSNAIFPLPLPLSEGQQVSPLRGLFEKEELVPLVLKHFEQPRELAVLARVCKGFNRIVRKSLYSTIWIRPWEEHCQTKLLLLFMTLSTRPDLCQLIKSLDVRFFPVGTRDAERYTLDEQAQDSLKNMHNLEHLIWTRDRSLNPILLRQITSLPKLRTLELSGHSHRYYDATLLGEMVALEDLRIMMPDSQCRDALLGVVKALRQRKQGGLKGLAIICRSSPLVDDTMLKDMAPSLDGLKRLTLWGCTRVTRFGVGYILTEAEGLEELSLDALVHSDMSDLSKSPSMPNLHTLSLSFPPPSITSSHPHLTSSDLPKLPSTPSLTSLLLTLSGDRAFLPPDFLPHFTSQISFTHLTRLSLLNLYITSSLLSSLLQITSNLEELYISTQSSRAIMECPELLSGSNRNLRIFHVNAPSPERWGPSVDDLLQVARGCTKLDQVGVGNRVYEVKRRFEGEVVLVELVRWGRIGIPGYFQVWRG